MIGFDNFDNKLCLCAILRETIVNPTDAKKAGCDHPESDSLKNYVLGIAKKIFGTDNLHINSAEMRHFMQVEVCTLCKKQNFLTCTESNDHDCDLVSAVVSK